MNTHARALAATLVLVSSPLMPGFGDEITLVDGRHLDGEILTKPGADNLEIRVRNTGISAVLHFKREQIATIAYGISERQQKLNDFDQALKALTTLDEQTPQSSDTWWALATKAKALEEFSTMRDIAKRIVARDATFAPAQLALGKVEQDGTWMTPTDAAVARGDVLFRGKWIPIAVRDATLADEERTRTEAADKVQRDREDRLARLEISKKEAELAAARRAAEPAPTQIVYTSIQPLPSIVYRPIVVDSPVCHPITPVTPIVIQNPIVTPIRPSPVTPLRPSPLPGGTGLQVNVKGASNGYDWALQYR